MRWAWLLVIAAFAGCAEERVAESGVLLAYEAGNHLHRYGGRVHADGRYELFSTDDANAAPDWNAYEPFTAEQVEEIAALVDEASRAVPDRLEPSGAPSPDAPVATFRLRDREVRVVEWPDSAPELAALLDRIAELRRSAPVPSTWRVWDGSAVVELAVPCDMGTVPALSRLRDALFMEGLKGDAAGADPPAGTPLVAVTFDAPGGREELEVHADGRRVSRAGGKEQTSEVAPGQLGAIRAALAETDWAALPSRLC